MFNLSQRHAVDGPNLKCVDVRYTLLSLKVLNAEKN